MAIYSYPKKVRLGNGQVYQLADSGWYRPTQDMTGDITDAPSFSELFQKQAQNTYDPLYKPLEDQTNARFDTMRTGLLDNIKYGYHKRGFGDSTYAANDSAKAETDVAGQKQVALNNLMMEKLGKISGDVSTQMDTQRKGEQTDYERRIAEQQAAAAAQAAAEERAYKQRLAEMDLESQRIAAKTKSSSGGITPYQSAQLSSKQAKAEQDTIDKANKALQSDFDQAAKMLRTGQNWGSVTKWFKTRHGDVDWNTIDNMLDKGFWAKKGAYETYMSKQNKNKSGGGTW